MTAATPTALPSAEDALREAIARVVRVAMQEEFLRGTAWETTGKGRVAQRYAEGNLAADAILALQSPRASDEVLGEAGGASNALIERLSELLAKATPGPWAYDTSEPDPMFTPNWSIYPVADCEYSIAEVNGQVKKSAAEAQLIVEAVNALPTLLAALSANPVPVDASADRLAVIKVFDAAMTECQRVADDTRFADDVMPGEREWYRRGAVTCAASMGVLASKAVKSLSHTAPVADAQAGEGFDV